MTIMNSFKLILPVFLAMSIVAFAQEPTTLTLQQAIDVALKNNRDLSSQRLSIENADAQVTEAFGNALPSLTLNARYTRNLQKQVFYFPGSDGIVKPISVGSDNALSTDLTLNQIIFNSAVFTGVGTAKTYSKISRQQLRAKTADVVLAVKRAYYTALFAKQVLQVNETLMQNASENMKNTQVLYKAGLRAEFDAIRAEVQYANQQPVVVQARDNYEMALDNLKLTLSLDDTKRIDLAESLMRPASSGQTEPDVQTAKNILEKYNATLEALRLNTEVNKELIAINKSEYLPTVALFGTYQMQAQSDNFSGLDFQPTSYIGLNLSLNLFNGYKTNAKVQQAQIAYEQSRFQLDQTEDALKTQLQSILRRIDYARQRIAVSDQTIRQAERGYQIATVSYKAGTGTQLQINDADLAMAQARLNQLNAVYDYDIALAELESLLGERYTLIPSGDNVEYSMK
jgi:outer membrane protein TolC